MARVIPTLPPRSAFGAGGYAELALLETLEQGLSGAYTLFHSVDFHPILTPVFHSNLTPLFAV
jgi:hypothetical protein